MKKVSYRKYLAIGIILLFVGASVLPVVNSMQIENEKTPVENQEILAFPILEYSCRFHIQFFGNVTRNHPIEFGPIIFFQRATSTDSSVGGIVANITIINWRGVEYSWNLPNYVIFRGWFIADFETDLPPAQETYQGYMKGWAAFLMIAW